MMHQNFQPMRKDIDASICGGEERHFLDYQLQISAPCLQWQWSSSQRSRNAIDCLT